MAQSDNQEENMHDIGVPKILVIDDSLTMRSALLGELRKMGAHVSEAPDGIKGLETAISSNFDLIITDVDMPGIDGFEVCSRLKSIPATKSTPVVILSARDGETDIERGFRAGAAAYLTKTNARAELHNCISGLLERSSLIKGRTVLVIDRSTYVRKLIGDALLEAGFSVRSAADGDSALRNLMEVRPDLILCDSEISKESGFSFFHTLHAEKSLAEVPLIIMSSSTDRATMRRMLQHGASAFLNKPFSIDHLLITAERLLSDHFRFLLKEKQRLDSERELILGSITSLVLALEARDRYTRGHSDSVAKIAVAMAERMGFGAESVDKIKTAGSLHDVGKIGIRDDILLKDGPLTDEEYAVIKRHPSVGASILSPIESLSDIVPAILNHHERMDGKGYPQALHGQHIHIFARIIAVADTFDALTSDRPYRKAFSDDKAMQIMAEAKGTQLCPECLDAFLSSDKK